MGKKPEFDFSKLSIEERIQLAEDLWNSIRPDAGPDELPLTEAQRAELERRLETADRDPGASRPWEEVRARLFELLGHSE